MQTVHYIKTSTFLLVSIIPLSIIGYLFAADYDNLFFLYEWALAVIVAVAGVTALTGAVKTNDNLRWVLFTVLAFCVHFSVLGLFLGPFSVYSMFWVYYAVTFFVFGVYVCTFYKVDRCRSITVIFFIISVIFTFYMLVLNSLWGVNLT